MIVKILKLISNGQGGYFRPDEIIDFSAINWAVNINVEKEAKILEQLGYIKIEKRSCQNKIDIKPKKKTKNKTKRAK